MERLVRHCVSFEEADAVDLADWLALPGAERLRIGEELRRTAFEDGEAPFVRVLSFRAPNDKE
ncbi:MAG TPA: hypothetical protein VH142_10760 [Polyangiaceae bacterium]|jgi:hypothetical protein|nr:hypothetical protein [Polyangiaceae bacterium]